MTATATEPAVEVYWVNVGNGWILVQRPGAKVVLCAGRDGRLKTRGHDGLLVDLDPDKHPVAQTIQDALMSPGGTAL